MRNTMDISQRNESSSDIQTIAAARHICEEASKVLSTLRRGSPLVSRGSLVHNLRELRHQVRSHFLDPQPSVVQLGYFSLEGNANGLNDSANNTNNNANDTTTDTDTDTDTDTATATDIPTSTSTDQSVSTSGSSGVMVDQELHMSLSATSMEETKDSDTLTDDSEKYNLHTPPKHHLELVHVGAYAQPFLDVILDPRAAGPHTLIALRSLHRLVSRQSLTLTSSSTLYQPPKLHSTNANTNTNSNSTSSTITTNSKTQHDFRFEAEMEPLMRGVLECRFEQTDAGADEAVEMAIADLLSLIVSLDVQRVMDADVIMEAFNTVFVTRNTFVHSPALCYHFEQVLDGMIRDLFSNLKDDEDEDDEDKGNNNGESHKEQCAAAATLIMEFLVSQLLHTPLTMDDGGGNHGNIMNSGSLDAYTMHNDTRILCLRLIQTCLKIGWGGAVNEDFDDDGTGSMKTAEGSHSRMQSPVMNGGIMKIIQDDLCLSLLLVGQGIWAYQDPSSGALPGMISMNVLSEICSTLSTLWSIASLRNVLTTQFETIFTGFYQRALSLLRRLPVPEDSATFHANQIFDAEVEIILESLVDILSLHCDNHNRGTFETLFVTYDCSMTRPDVGAGLADELSRCCSGTIEESISMDMKVNVNDPGKMPSSGASTPVRQSSSVSNLEMEYVPQLRDVPAHLKELCAEAQTDIMKTLFSGATKLESLDSSSTSTNSTNNNPPSNNSLHFVKEQKIMMHKAVELFNQKSSTGFEFLVKNKLIADPVTPEAIASFLRGGIVLGLDKRAVGEYLGAKGKSPVAGKSPPNWERDWFHKEALLAYCSSFHFKNQSLLDCLRMFLAAFRLPGEAQQIDRILQAFSESCGLQCEESQSGNLRLFSTDPKKASDAAYLLSFSIIMLNTDLHNENIRPDRKMKVDDFVKNNTDYGRDITDPDKKFPREYLEGIYRRIKDEHIRTEGEGADGIMTFERWKDVMRNTGDTNNVVKNRSQTCIISDLVLEVIQDHIFSSICGFWGVSSNGKSLAHDGPQSGMLGVQSAVFGMDMAFEMLKGLKSFGETELFQSFFVRICRLTGLLGDYKNDVAERTSSFVQSIERQSAVVVVMKVAGDFGDFMGTKAWLCVLGILFELRDLKLLGGGTRNKHRSLIFETDQDLLRPDTRRDWEMRLVKQCLEATGGEVGVSQNDRPKSGLFGAMGRAFFGSVTTESPLPVNVTENTSSYSDGYFVPSGNGKEGLVLWNDLASSDEENGFNSDEENYELSTMIHGLSLGKEFESQLLQEDKSKYQSGPPITGLETYEDTCPTTPRARVRRRLASLCDYSKIVSETRFLDVDGVKALLLALTEIVDTKMAKDSLQIETPLVISPGSEALAEVMITEIALKNRDRIAALWSSSLKSHYQHRLAVPTQVAMPVKVIPGMEKCLTGLLRICYHTVHRDGVNNDVLITLKLLSPYIISFPSSDTTLTFNKHIAEGLWRICRDVDGLLLVGSHGWEGILNLISHCARGGEILMQEDGAKFRNLTDDDPALQAFRCMHLILHSVELRDVVPFDIIHSVRGLIAGGERQNCPKLSLAGLDLLLVLLTRLHLMTKTNKVDDSWSTYWLSLIEGIAESSDSRFPITRQHSIAMLRDALIDKNSEEAPVEELCRILNGTCMPIISQRITELVQHQTTLRFDHEEVMIELELCISTIFKPFLHHLGKLMDNQEQMTAVWMSLLSALSHLLGKETTSQNDKEMLNNTVLKATKDLATEHLRNSVMILVSKDVLQCDGDITSTEEENFSSMTWTTINSITYCKHLIQEWRLSGKDQKTKGLN